MRFIKKLLLIFIISMMMVSCASKAEKPSYEDDSITLKCALIGGGDYEPIYDNIYKFEKETGIDVEIVYMNNFFELDKKLKMDFETNTAEYDVISSHSSFFTQYVDQLYPLDEFFTHDDLQDFLPRLLNSGNKNGNQYIIPRHATLSCLHYRTDLFDDKENQEKFENEYGRPLTVPETWDEYYEVAMFFGGFDDIYGTQFAGKEEALTGRFYEILVSNGGTFIDENGRAGFNSPAGVKSVSMIRDLYMADATPDDMLNYIWDDLSKNWKDGKVALSVQWYSSYSYFQNEETSNVAGKFDIARMPKGDGDIHGAWIGVHGFSIPKSSENKEAAAQFIKFITNEDNALQEGKIGYLPVRSSVWDKLISGTRFSSDPLAKKRFELAKKQFSEDSFTPPLISEWVPASNVLFPILQKIISGEMEPQQGLDMAAQEINILLSD